MHKRALWILIVLAALALVLLIVFRGHDPGFERLMTSGRGYLEKGEATNAVRAYAQAVKAAPESIDARLNLANAFLLANNGPGVIEQCQRVIEQGSIAFGSTGDGGCASAGPPKGRRT